MKTFVLALMLFAPDGAKTEIPVEMLKFASMAECIKSSTFMNNGVIATAKNYSCVEYDPSRYIAAEKVTPKPDATGPAS